METEKVKDAAYYARIEKFIKDVTPLWRLKIGDTVTQEHLDSILQICGKEPQEQILGSVYFKDGKPTMRTGDAVNWEVKEYAECWACRGLGHFDEYGKANAEGRDCLECKGAGQLEPYEVDDDETGSQPAEKK